MRIQGGQGGWNSQGRILERRKLYKNEKKKEIQRFTGDCECIGVQKLPETGKRPLERSKWNDPQGSPSQNGVPS